MKKYIKVATLAICLSFTFGTVLGTTVGTKISATLKKMTIVSSNKENVLDVISYNNTTYVPLRKAGELLGESVDYKDGKIYLGENSSIATSDTTGTYKGVKLEVYYDACEALLRDALKYGDTIKFDRSTYTIGEPKTMKDEYKSNYIEINGKMTRQNTFGNFVPSDFSIDLKLNGDLHTIFVDGEFIWF